MKQYVEIFNELKNESGRIAKEQLLKKYENVEGLKEIFKFAYNPMIVTGLAKKKIEKEVKTTIIRQIDNIFDAMNFVKQNNSGNDKVIASVQRFLTLLDSQEERDLAISILTKDMPFGFSMNTLNKVYDKNFIPKYSVMLAAKYEPGKSDLSQGYSLSLKLDGNRITAFNYESGVKFYTRSGKEVEGLVELIEDFKRLPKDRVYDGEIIAHNPDGLPSKDLFNVTQTIVRRKGPKTGLNFVIFDVLSIDEFNEGKSKKVYGERANELGILEANYFHNTNLRKVPIFYFGNDETKIPEVLEQVEKEGFEGLMINLLNSHYETKRSKGILKVKTFHSADLLCTGVKEDIRGGKCGSIEVEYKGQKVYPAGLKDSEKELFWKNPELIVGKIVEIKYFEESQNQNGEISLRFPTFMRIRDDKGLGDVSYA